MEVTSTTESEEQFKIDGKSFHRGFHVFTRLHDALRKDCKNGLRCRPSRRCDEYIGAMFLALHLKSGFSVSNWDKFEEHIKGYFLEAEAFNASLNASRNALRRGEL
jgi:hypothetical protein